MVLRRNYDGTSMDLRRIWGVFANGFLPVDLARSYRGRYRPVMEKIRRALLSVSDKNGLVPLAQTLAAAGVEVVEGTRLVMKKNTPTFFCLRHKNTRPPPAGRGGGGGGGFLLAAGRAA